MDPTDPEAQRMRNVLAACGVHTGVLNPRWLEGDTRSGLNEISVRTPVACGSSSLTAGVLVSIQAECRPAAYLLLWPGVKSGTPHELMLFFLNLLL